MFLSLAIFSFVSLPYIAKTKMYLESTNPKSGNDKEANTLAQNPATASQVGL